MSKQYRRKQIARLIATGALVGMCGSAWASAFQLLEQNVTNLGTAYAGTASLAEDASTGFYNSAGLARLGQEQIAVSLIGIVPYSKLNVTNATATISAGSQSQLGSGSTKVRSESLVPAVHYFNRLDDCWVFGLNIVTPFGLKTKYKSSEIARYMATRAELRTYDIAPSLAYSFFEGFSIGAGVDFVNALTKIDAVYGVGNLANDGVLQNTFSRWGVGGHVGLLYAFNDDCTRIGVNWRSEVKIKGRGQSVFSSPFLGGLPGGNPAFLGDNLQGVRATFKLPQTAVASIFHQIDEQWAIMADAQWTGWQKHWKSLTLNYDDGSSLTTNLRFKDTWRFALGGSYQFDDCWLWRAGVAYDKSPIHGKNSNSRTAFVPDSNRTWVALGAQYRFSKCLAMELGYAHVFFKNASINQGPPTRIGGPVAPVPSQSLIGTYKHQNAEVFGLQFTWDLV